MKPASRKESAWSELRRLTGALSHFLSTEHKRRLAVVSLWACGVSVLEMLVAAAVIPYVQCLSGRCMGAIESAVGTTGWPLVPVLSLALFLLIALKLIVQAILGWSAAQFNQQVQRDTVRRLLDGYLHLDWAGFRSQHRAHYFRRCATTAVDAAYVSQQCVTMISAALILVFLTGLMLWQYPLASVLLGAGFLAVNAATQRLIGRRLGRAAHEREAALKRWSLGMAEAFASFREVRLYGLERFFLGHLDRSIDSLAESNRRLSFLPALPRLVLDFAVFGVLLLVVSLWLLTERPIADLLPQLIFYAVVARAILPAMMSLLSTRAVLSGSIVNIELVLEELEQAAAGRAARVGIPPSPSAQAYFSFERVTFGYAADRPPVIADADVRIPHPSWLAIVGPSGEGKSTLMELLCGIHVPVSGRVVHAWPEERPALRIAYLPQHVALLDGSVAENVVFGFDAGDADRVREALALACLDELVERLPGGLDARIGADGTRLSGGERQRLALARALYRLPDLLLLDEATSGLDEATEARVLSAVRRARPATTVVYITHRTANLRFADRVLRLHEGKLADATPMRSAL